MAALRDFVSDPPVPDKWSPDPVAAYRQQLAKEAAERRQLLLDFVNGNLLLPGPEHALLNGPYPTDYTAEPSLIARAGPVVNSLLDITDKFNSAFVPESMTKASESAPAGRQASKLRMIAAKHPAWKFWAGSVRWSLKGAGWIVNGYNLIQTIRMARYDYQNQVSFTDWASAVTGMVPVIYDTLTVVEGLLLKDAARFFPDLVTEAETGPAWFGAAKLAGAKITKIFGGAVAVANIISGALTAYSMGVKSVHARAMGDYAAASYYQAGAFGGGAVMTGGVVFAVALVLADTGIEVALTGVLATVGILLVLAGTLLTLVAYLFGASRESGALTLFARFCFLGKPENTTSPFGRDPPEWSRANASAPWPVKTQWEALVNLLSMFSMTMSGDLGGQYLQCSIKPGLVLPGSTIDVGL